MRSPFSSRLLINHPIIINPLILRTINYYDDLFIHCYLIICYVKLFLHHQPFDYQRYILIYFLNEPMLGCKYKHCKWALELPLFAFCMVGYVPLLTTEKNIFFVINHLFSIQNHLFPARPGWQAHAAADPAILTSLQSTRHVVYTLHWSRPSTGNGQLHGFCDDKETSMNDLLCVQHNHKWSLVPTTQSALTSCA